MGMIVRKNQMMRIALTEGDSGDRWENTEIQRTAMMTHTENVKTRKNTETLTMISTRRKRIRNLAANIRRDWMIPTKKAKITRGRERKRTVNLDEDMIPMNQ